ncbi:PREDICTED: zinc finger CCCH domain-containing protein 7-like [Populus euphratica]|uniref:Zinc finger CCCH domain-containing protein 7-like n=1 Tax=Populus euphratica TaxID=75702 RepID=A0AAJ6T0H6_POPEU|nr:PREDICTED: zinc finger CCCH domain-containing protein 7-like [Populus euphratica]
MQYNSAIQCLKKHSYVCPTYEATGSCPQGSKCNRHHPKNRSKEKKSKRSRDNNAQGRYFGLMHTSTTELRNPVPVKPNVLDNDAISFKGSIADYISLDVIDEVVENTIPADEHTALGDSDPLELQLGDLDELIKPVRIMNI